MENADVVIIGGGVMGASIAFELAQRRVGRVVVLERSFVGAGSSGKSGAIIRQHYSHPLTAAMAQYGLQRFRTFPEIVGGPSVFTQAGMVLIAPVRDYTVFEQTLAMLRGLGIRTGSVSRDDLRSIDPQAVLDDDERAGFEEDAGYCEALQVVSSLCDAARSRGVEILEGTEVIDIVSTGDRVSAVVTPRGPIATRTVVLAAGPWVARLAATIGVALPVQSCRTQVALVRRPCDFGPPRPAYGDFHRMIYFKPTHGEMLHVGNIDPREQSAVVDPDRYVEVADAPFVDEMRSKLVRRYPALRRGVGRGGFAALYAVTPDWHPIIDRLPGIEGAYVAAGFSGHGFKMSPAIGTLITELIIDGSTHTFDIQPFRADRFAKGELFGSLPGSRSVMG